MSLDKVAEPGEAAGEAGEPTEASGPEEGAGGSSAKESAASKLRDITDVRTLRALAHPIRIALLEALLLEGPLTATEAGERIGESPSSCSFHLRQLARYSFVEEAGGRSGRARPWRVTSTGMQISASPDDPEMELAVNAVSHLFRERQLGRYRKWLETRASFPAAWRQAAGEGQFLFYLTAEELESLSDELVEMLVISFPVALPSEP